MAGKLRRLAMWIVWNVPCGRLAPHLFAFAIGAKSYRRVDDTESDTKVIK